VGELESGIEENFRTLLPLYEHTDLRVECASDGVYRCSVPLNERNSNHFGTMHAALQWASAEVLGGLVLAASGLDLSKFLGVVKSFQIDFKKPAETAVVAETFFSDIQMAAIELALKDHDRHDLELSIVVRHVEADTLAEAKGVYAVRPLRS
jgi:acyl-coenzyme A thioesterase PaaI-like protein